MESEKDLEKEHVTVTIKMDGENTSMTRETCYARSRETESHWTRDLVRALHGKIGYEIPEGWRICGENLYAQHSIAYKNLESYFIGFSVWNRLTCLSWQETMDYLGILDIPIVPVIYSGIYDRKQIDKAFKEYMSTSTDGVEGYVVRASRAFKMSEYRKVVGKYVHKSFNICHGNWYATVKKNELKP
jgi:hypothetical protein